MMDQVCQQSIRTLHQLDSLQCIPTMNLVTNANVKMVEYLDRKQKAEKSNPLTTTRIYWCLGLGETAEELIKHVTVPHMFKAVFKLEKKPPLENVQLFEPSPMPPFIKELLALAQTNKLEHPARKIPVLDVLYEDPPPPKLVELGGENGKPGALSSPLGVPPRGDLPYVMLAKAIVSGIVCLQQQMEAYSKLDGSITGNFEIPEAVPRKDVNVTYYKALLDTVPAEWVSLPILLHCMVEQVSYYDTSLEDMAALEAANANERLATGFDASILRLGQGLSCMRRSSALLHDIVEEIRAKQAEEDLNTVEEMLKVFLEIAGNEAERRNEEAEKLAADAAAKAAEGEVAATVDAIAVGKEPPEKRKSHRKSVLKLVQDSEGDKRSMKDGLKSSKDNGRNSSKDDWQRTSREMSSRTGLTLKQGLSKTGSKKESHISWDPAASEFKELVGASAEKGDEHSLVMYEFSRVDRLERTVKHKALEFLDSVDVVNVEKHMLSLLGYPGKDRASMPKIPFLSDEKRGACLEALRWFVRGQSDLLSKDLYSNYKQEQREQTYGRPRLMETLERPGGPRSKMGPLNLAAIQRYKKLRMLLEILSEEEKRAFNLPDDSERAPAKGSEALTPKEEQADDDLTEEERKELDKGNDILHDCGCQSLRSHNSGRLVSDAPPKEDSTLSSQSKRREPFLPFQRITDWRFIEALPSGLLGEVYGRARTRLPYRAYRYDRDEDCMIEALYADDRDHVWQGVVASQIGFGDFVAKMDNPSPAMLVTGKHATYDVEEKYAIVLERYKCHLAEHQGLVWTGHPAKTDIQWEPQTTVIKDGHIILLRAHGPDDSSDSPRVKSVNACLRDGIVVSFFIDNDGTMSMQVTNPANQTFEITSTGIVRMFASHLHASKVEEAETPEGEVPGRRGDGKTAEQPPLPSPAPPPPPKEGAEGAKSEEPVEKRIFRDLLVQEKGEQESWRCILPTGAVVRYRNNGDAQVLYRQGNVSDFRHDYEGGPCWITANNEGFLVAQRDPREGEAAEKLAEEELAPRGAPPPPPEKKVFIKKGSKAGSPALEVPSEVPEVRPIEPTDPIFIPLPKLKVEHFYDPETGDEVMTREDLVVVIKSERKKSTFVQHADGTQIYSVITEVCSTPENVMSQGEAMMDQIAEVFPKNPPRIKPEVLRPEGEIASKDEGGEGNEYGERRVSAGAGGTEKKGSVRHTLAVADKKDNLMGKKNPSISKSEGSEKPYIKPSLLDLHPRPVLPEISTTWHIHKEGLAKVQGKFGSETQQSGVCVEFETVDGLYAATWSKQARQISLSMPGGASLYSVGSTISFDPTDGSKKYDPYQTEEDDRKHGPFVNTNGVYVFDVVEGSLTFTDNAGQGFRVFGRGTEWETIISGKTATQNAKEAPIFEQLLLAHATAIPEGLEQDLYAKELAKYFPNDPPYQTSDLRKSLKKGNPEVPAEPPPKPEKKGSREKSVKESKLGSVLGAEIVEEAGSTSTRVDVRADFELTPLGEWKPLHPISRPATPSPPSSEPSEPIMLGPYPRLFVIHEAGHGYEFLHEEMYQQYETAKFYDKLCSKNSEKYVISDEEAVFHTFVTTENRKQIGLYKLIKEKDNEDEEHNYTPSLTLPASRRVSLHAKRVQGKHRSNKLQTRTKCDWIQLQYSLPKLPRVINPSTPEIDSNKDTSGFVYRQIVELPSIQEAIQKKMDKILEVFSRWQWVNLELQEIEIIPDTRTDEDILMERYIACRIRESKKFKKRETLRASRLSFRG
ncbi:uncharacterized protein [Physcomitrium patens]|uniref:uncharacterized protein isoform X2 n=1 Tax=Physcomitrium patens TaxID=3218 RepID=UPI003CCCF48D